MKPKVALLTSLVDFSPGYSLNGVILDHARMLRRSGWDYDILTIRNFNRRDLEAAQAEGLSVKPILPQTVLVDYRPNEPPRATTDKEVGFEEQARRHAEGHDGAAGYLEALEPYDAICSHDLMFLSWHLPQNAALRRAIDKWPGKNWAHWVHSGPSEEPRGTCYPSTLRYQAAPHSVYCFLNETQRHACALMLHATHDQIAVVYNPRDPRDLYGFSPQTEALIDAHDLMNHEIMQVYPFSTPRWRAKGVDKLSAIFGQWKRMGVKVKLVLVNAHANSPCDKAYVDQIEDACTRAGLDVDKDVILTSRFAEAWERGAKKSGDKDAEREARGWRHCVPHRVVRELTLLANVFVFPSESECCSLIQAEAAQSGKFMVLNADFPAMAEFAHGGTLAFDFNANPVSNEDYYECVAKEAWSKLQTETAILNATKARTTVYNRDWIWRRQLEPLLWRKFSGRPEEKKEEEQASRPARGASSRAGRRGTLPPPESREAFDAPDDLEKVPAAREEAQPEKPKIEFHPDAISLVAPAISEDEAVSMLTNLSSDLHKVDFGDPWPGMSCPAFGECSVDRRAACYLEAGHCPMLDERPAKPVESAP